MDKNKEKNLKAANDELLSEVLREAKEKKSSTVNLVEELISGKSFIPDVQNDLYQNNKNKKEELEKTSDNDIIDYDQYSFDNEDDNSEEYDYDDVPYDMVPLPSKGKIYKGIKSKIAVAYLTASDEDLITSPNLYVDNRLFDTLLRRKIMDKKIKPENLCKGDRDAIILWLRASGYGENFPVNITDPETGQVFDSSINLSKLRIKELEIEPDENGLFEFVLPKSGDIVKFRFMTYKDDVGYTKLLSSLYPKIKKYTLTNDYNSIKNIIDNDKNLGFTKKNEYLNHLNSIKEYADSINENDDTQYLRNVTYILDRTIVSIGGRTDRNFIKKYISMMPVSDSIAYRKYYNNNIPEVDFNTTVERPGSLGGGSISTFLNFDHSIFLDFT